MMALRVTYRTSLDGELRASVTKHLVKYLLFMRGQVPCLYDELLQFVESFQLQQQQKQVEQPSRRRLPVSGGIKKAVKCVEAAEQLFRVQLDAVFSMHVKRVALIFGSSMMSPREAVIVDFDDVDVEVEDAGSLMSTATTASPQSDQEDGSLEVLQMLTPPSSTMTREKLMHLCAQKLMSALFTHSMEHFSSALPATKLHIAVLAERQSTRIPGFLPKQQFKLRLPKDKRGVRTHYMTICSGVDSKKQSQLQDLQPPATEQPTSNNTSRMASDSELQASRVQNSADTSDPGMVWYVLEKPIPGFSGVISTLDGQ